MNTSLSFLFVLEFSLAPIARAPEHLPGELVQSGALRLLLVSALALMQRGSLSSSSGRSSDRETLSTVEISSSKGRVFAACPEGGQTLDRSQLI